MTVRQRSKVVRLSVRWGVVLHALRRGGITYALDDWLENAVSDRANASGVVLDEHYDPRSAKKMEQRSEHLGNL